MKSFGRFPRRSAILGAVATAFLLAATSAGAAPLLLASDYESGTITTVDTATHAAVGAPIVTGGGPKAIAIAPDARTAYVVDGEGGNVLVVDISTRRVVAEPVTGAGGLGSIAVSPDGTKVYVTDYSAEAILVIDCRSEQLDDEIALSAQPTGIAVAPDGHTAYAVEEEAEAVQPVDLVTDEAKGPPIEVGASPQDVAISPDGGTLYVGAEANGLAAIDTATGRVEEIAAGLAGGVAVSPDGRTAWVGNFLDETVSVVDLQTRSLVKTITVGRNPGRIRISPDGKSVYVAVDEASSTAIRVIDADTLKVVDSIPREDGGPRFFAITPDRSPTASLVAPSMLVAGSPVQFRGSGSTDPDGSVAGWNWSFGDGGTSSAADPLHLYSAPGAYGVSLSVVDDEGCGEAVVYTGQTAYCSGNAGAAAARRITVAPPPAAPPSSPSPLDVCRTVPRILGVAHRRSNGTARLTVKVPAAGSIFLFGKKIHAITRRTTAADTLHVTLHARVEVNKRLKKEHRTGVRYRVTFYPSADCSPTTVHRSLALLRAPRKKR